MTSAQNRVYLLGAGPGDPELLTLKAARILASAEVVIYDHLVGEGVLDLIPANAKRIYVGKESGRHTLPQPAINETLVNWGRVARTVVRLKGGDPYIFGRGGEEVEALVAAGLSFEVVPGVTAASGMAAYAGIPLTHRDHAQAVTFVTGHLKDGSLDLDWPALVHPRQTLVIYMGIGGLAEICRQLVAFGRSPQTPAVVVRNASLRDQASLCADLATLPEVCRQQGIEPPGLIVVGDVVRLADKLNWFDSYRAAIAESMTKVLPEMASSGKA